MKVGEYYKIIIPHRYWSAEFKKHAITMFGVCDVIGHPLLSSPGTRRARVYAKGFYLSADRNIYAPVWPGHKPDFSIIGNVLKSKIYLKMPTDVFKIVLKYL